MGSGLSSRSHGVATVTKLPSDEKISLDELVKAATRGKLGFWSRAKLGRLIQLFDQDNDGRIAAEEFRKGIEEIHTLMQAVLPANVVARLSLS